MPSSLGPETATSQEYQSCFGRQEENPHVERLVSYPSRIDLLILVQDKVKRVGNVAAPPPSNWLKREQENQNQNLSKSYLYQHLPYVVCREASRLGSSNNLMFLRVTEHEYLPKLVGQGSYKVSTGAY